MTKNRKARSGILVPVVEEVPRISDTEREELRKSLDRARADIAAGNYDVMTPATLRQEFEDVFDGRHAQSAGKPERERGRQGLRRGRR